MTQQKFEPTKDGLYLKEPSGRRRICPAIEVTAIVRVDGSTRRDVRLKFTDVDDTTRETTVQPSLLGKRNQILDHLVDYGYQPPADKESRDLIAEYLATAEPRRRIRAVHQPGWVDVEHGGCFVLPDGPIPTTAADVEYRPLQKGAPIDAFGRSGDLRGWQTEVAQPAADSSRLVFAICLALAAPLLRFQRVDNVGVHLVGPSGCGKTTCLLVAKSVAGPAQRGQLPTWDFTDAGIEETAVSHNDSLLVLDELARSTDTNQARRVQHVAYQIANGRARMRSRAYTQHLDDPTLVWRLFFLSSGEQSLSEVAGDYNMTRRGGELLRLIDLPAEAGRGIFDRVSQTRADPRQLAEALETAASDYHGTALPAFVDALCEDWGGIAKKVGKLVERFFEKAGVPSDGWERRFARPFAFAYAAGMLAVKRGVLPWQRATVRRSVVACYTAARNAVPDAEAVLEDGLARLADKLDSDAICDIRKRKPTPQAAQAADGYRRRERNGAERVLVKPKRFASWFDNDLQHMLVLDWLGKAGALVRPSDRPIPTVQAQIAGIKRRRRYVALKPKRLIHALKETRKGRDEAGRAEALTACTPTNGA